MQKLKTGNMSDKLQNIHRSLAGKLVKIQSVHKTHNVHGSLEETLKKIRLHIVEAVRGSLTERLMKILKNR